MENKIFDHLQKADFFGFKGDGVVSCGIFGQFGQSKTAHGAGKEQGEREDNNEVKYFFLLSPAFEGKGWGRGDGANLLGEKDFDQSLVRSYTQRVREVIGKLKNIITQRRGLFNPVVF